MAHGGVPVTCLRAMSTTTRQAVCVHPPHTRYSPPHRAPFWRRSDGDLRGGRAVAGGAARLLVGAGAGRCVDGRHSRRLLNAWRRPPPLSPLPATAASTSARGEWEGGWGTERVGSKPPISSGGRGVLLHWCRRQAANVLAVADGGRGGRSRWRLEAPPQPPPPAATACTCDRWAWRWGWGRVRSAVPVQDDDARTRALCLPPSAAT